MIRQIILILLSFLPSIDQFVTKVAGNYFIGLTIRIATHLITPVLFRYHRLKNWKESFIEPLRPGDRKETLFFSIIGSIGAVVLITALFFAIKPFMDLSLISQELSTIYPVTIPVYIIVGLRISFINPFIEEDFWRGLIFKEYHEHTGGGYWTGILFAVHHLVMLFTWFSSWWQLAIVTVGLAIVGLLFNWFYARTKSIIASYVTHMAADITIIVIGFFILF